MENRPDPLKRLGPYEIVSAIGAGGMGEVYKAHDTRLNRDVAVKVLPVSVARDPERLGRFEREAQAVAALSHPNILSIFDFGVADGVTYAVTELLQGETLRDAIRTGPLSPRRAVEYGTQIAHGLAAAHDKGLVHRDLKPENVFVTTDGHVKILDFGLARSIAAPAVAAEGPTVLGGDAGTTPGMVVGTMGYMAPEQVRGETVDARTDIFAFGALMYELLTGDRAFKGATPADTMSAILREDPADARTREGLLPPTLEHLIRRCLEKSPARRFQSAHDLAFALEHALGSSAASAAPPAVATPATVRPPWLLPATVGVTMLVAGALLGRFLQPAAAPRLQPTFTPLTAESGIENWASLSPDGSSFVYVSHASGNDDIYLRRIDGHNVTNLTPDSPADDTTPAYSPDGKLIAFRSERNGGGIYLMEATGENVRRVSEIGENPAWSPDGKFLAFATEQTRNPAAKQATSPLWILDLATGAKRKVVEVDAMQPSWAPDGKRLVFWRVENGQRLLKTVSVDGGTTTAVFPSDKNRMYWSPVWAPDGRWIYYVSDESGAMSIGRIPVDAKGLATGPPETINAPTPYAGPIALSHDGRQLAYEATSVRYALLRAPFDLTTGTAGESTTILAGALPITGVDVSPDGRSIAFGSIGSAREDIFTIDRDGSHLRRLTGDNSRNRGPSWTPDGQRIAFYTNRGGHYEAWSMNPDGSDQKRIVPSPDRDDWMWPRFSPTGQLSVMSLKAPAIFDATTSPPKLLEVLPSIDATGDTLWPFAWSPDGTMLAGWAQSAKQGKLLNDVVIYRPATRQYERMPGLGAVITWLPDNKRLLVSGDRMYVLDISTRRRTVAAPWEFAGPLTGIGTALGDKGHTIYSASITTDADLWLMTLGPRK